MNALFIIPLLLDIPVYIIILAAAGLLLFIAILVLIIFAIKRPRSKHPMRKVLNNNGINELIEALGGRDNILKCSPSGRSRLSIKLANNDLIDSDRLKELGVTSIITMSEKVIIVFENVAQEVSSSLKESIPQQDEE